MKKVLPMFALSLICVANSALIPAEAQTAPFDAGVNQSLILQQQQMMQQQALQQQALQQQQQQQQMQQQQFAQQPQATPTTTDAMLPSTATAEPFLQGRITNLDLNRLPAGFRLAQTPFGPVIVSPNGQIFSPSMLANAGALTLGRVTTVPPTISTSRLLPNADQLARAYRSNVNNRRPFNAGPMTIVHTESPVVEPTVMATRPFIVNGVIQGASGTILAEAPGIRQYSFARVMPRGQQQVSMRKKTFARVIPHSKRKTANAGILK